jgi:hypothetical protein
MNAPNSQKIKEAFVKVAEAELLLKEAKQNLSNLFAMSEEVEASRFVVEHVDRIAPPSDDNRDVVFARLNAAQERLTEAFRSGALVNARAELSEAYKGIEQAYIELK